MVARFDNWSNGSPGRRQPATSRPERPNVPLKIFARRPGQLSDFGHGDRPGLGRTNCEERTMCLQAAESCGDHGQIDDRI
jgi:hypothetical protein